VCVLTFNPFLQLMPHPLWSGWFRPASQSLMPRPTHWRQQSKRSSLSTSGLAQCDAMVDVIMLKVTGIQQQERPHQHRLRHLQRKITQLLQRQLQFSRRCLVDFVTNLICLKSYINLLIINNKNKFILIILKFSIFSPPYYHQTIP